MTQDIYINGERVDVDSGTKVVLNFNSNLFGDISKITASNSYTIQLPRTVRNARILDNAGVPAYDSSFIRKYNNVRYVRNGITMIEDAQAVLLSVGKSYEVAMTWGLIGGFADFVADGKKLNELAEVNQLTDSYLLYEKNKPGLYKSDNFLYSFYKVGIDILPSGDGLHPSVRVPWLLKRISESYKFKISYPKDRRIDEMVIPLTTSNSAFRWAKNLGTGAEGVYTFKQDGMAYVGVLESGYQPLTVYVNSEAKAMIKTTTLRNGVYNYTYNVGDQNSYTQVEVKLGDRLEVRRKDGTLVMWNKYTSNIDVRVMNERVVVGDMFPIIANLPDFKQVDFLKAVCNMAGLFAIKDMQNNDAIRLVSAEELIQNKSKAVDWSSRLVGDDKPKKVSYTFGDWSQVNRLKYKEDSLMSVADGVLYVENDTIDKDKDLVTLPFAATDGNTIKHYELSDDKLSVKDVKVQPRIMLEMDAMGLSSLSFCGLEFDNLVKTNYVAYQNIIRKPVVVTDTFRLNELDLKDLDYTIPIYVAQWGKYYAVIKITYNGDTSEVELIQL